MPERSLHGRTLLITGASRGIGLAIACRAARDGANVALLAKTTEPNPKLPGTLSSAAEAVELAGGHALPLRTDIRDDAAIAEAVRATVDRFGGIDILVNNASAISLTSTADTPMNRPGQPDEVAPCYVFLACEDSSYSTGQVLHPNGGTVVNG